MSYISNLKIKNDKITYELINEDGDIKISLANAIRREMISGLYLYTIDKDNVRFYENNSILDNERLKKRLSEIPILSNNNSITYDDISISCKISNEEEIIKNVYVKDFICKQNDEIIDNSLLFNKDYLNILFAKLKYNQVISFEAKLNRNNAEFGGALYSSVVACIYTFNIDKSRVKDITKDMNKEDERKFNTQDNERIYEKNKIGEPYKYNFSYESAGFYDPLEISIMTIDILISKLDLIKNKINDKKSKKISIQENHENPDFYDFLIDDENETIGNLLSTYLTYEQNIFYCGFLIEHPLKKNIILRIKLVEDNTIENNILVIISIIDKLVGIFNKIKSDLVKA